MICPLYRGECNLVRCHDNGRCMPAPADNLASPPPPTLAEIEQLAGDVSLSLSALMAAIRAYWRE